MEPENKRPKLTQETNHHDKSPPETKAKRSPSMKIKCILADEYTNQIETVKVIIGTIDNMKVISSLMDQLSRNLPLLDLQHLKRVRKNQIILCKVNALKIVADTESIHDEMREAVINLLTEQNMDPTIASELCCNLSIVKVASVQPKLRWQYETMNRLWPCKFHPNKYLEQLFSNTNFKEDEKAFHLKIMSAVKHLAFKESSTGAGICIDPRTNSIVAIALKKPQFNPLLHCPMVLVDMVARSQNGGVREYPDATFMENSDKLNFAGIETKYHQILTEKFSDLKFGAEIVDPNRKICNLENVEQDNLAKYGPYLCTGYYVYLLEEPCLMCAMALVHSRVKRVFYQNSTSTGALGSIVKLHTVKNLNHHFEVFQYFDEDVGERI